MHAQSVLRKHIEVQQGNLCALIRETECDGFTMAWSSSAVRLLAKVVTSQMLLSSVESRIRSCSRSCLFSVRTRRRRKGQSDEASSTEVTA